MSIRTLRSPHFRGANNTDTAHATPGCRTRGWPLGKQLVPTAKSWTSPSRNTIFFSVTGLPVPLVMIVERYLYQVPTRCLPRLNAFGEIDSAAAARGGAAAAL